MTVYLNPRKLHGYLRFQRGVLWCEHLQFSYGNMRSCNDGRHLYGGYAQYVYLENKGRQDIKNRWDAIEDYWMQAIQDGNDAAPQGYLPVGASVQPSLPAGAGRAGREGQHDPRKYEGRHRPVDGVSSTFPSRL